MPRSAAVLAFSIICAVAATSCSATDDHLTSAEAAEKLAKSMPHSRSRLEEVLAECIAAKRERRPSTVSASGCEGAVWQECLAAWSEGRDPEVGDWECEDIGEKP